MVATLEQVFRDEWGRIVAGRAELDRAVTLGGRGLYVLQAAIAAAHMETPCDWARIVELHGALSRLTDSPVVRLNEAIAVAEVDGAEAGLRMVDRLELDGLRYFHATRADLLRRLGRPAQARAAYRRACQLTDDGPDRRFLERRLCELDGATATG